ncbi:MAG: ABC transporter substrate-binding protein [Promethearchaeota archaeon]
MDSWDAASNDVLEQVVETLFTYDLSDPNLPLVPLLAESYSWNTAVNQLTVILRKNIVFHDDMPFNATAIKWNVDRWLYLTNCTGLLKNETGYAPIAFPYPLYYFPNGTPIIDHVVINGEYNVTFYLTHKFSAFTDLLTYTSFAIISPYSHAAFNDTYLSLAKDKVIGTGPYIYEYYRTDIEVRLSRNPRYWRTGTYFEKLVFSVIKDRDTRTNAMLNHEVDIVFGVPAQRIAELNASPTIKIVEMGKSLLYYYIGFNNKKLNVTWRKALSYSINFTYIINDTLGGLYPRAPPAVPENMPGHNASVQKHLPNINVTYAREIMQSMGFGVGWDTDYPGTDENKWTNATFATKAFGEPLHLNEFFEDSFNQLINTILIDNFQLIGVDAYVGPKDIRKWEEFLDLGEKDPNQLNVYVVGWAPDYLDAYNMLAPLFLPDSSSNFAQVNISEVTNLILKAASEPNKTIRLSYYEQIQYILFEKEFVHAPFIGSYSRYIHSTDIKGFPYNTMGKFYAYPIYRV